MPRVILVAALLVAIVAGIYVVMLLYDSVLKPVLDVAPPFLIAIALALLLDPFIDLLQRRGLSRGQGVAVVGLLFLVGFLLVGFLLVPKVAQQATDLAANFPEYAKQAQVQFDGLLEKQKPMLQKLKLPTSTDEFSARFSSQLRDWGARSAAVVADFLTGLLSRVLWLVIIPLATLWLLRDIDYLKAKLLHFTPERHREGIARLTVAVGGVFGNYIRGMVIVAILFSVVAMVALSIAGLPYGLMIGALAGVLYMVPYIGVLMLVGITGIVAMIHAPGNTGYAIGLMAMFLFQSFIVFDQLVTPKVVGGSVGVHPVLAMFSLTLGARLFGVVGLLAAVPVAASVQVALGQLWPKVVEPVKPAERRRTDPPPEDPQT